MSKQVESDTRYRRPRGERQAYEVSVLRIQQITLYFFEKLRRKLNGN